MQTFKFIFVLFFLICDFHALTAALLQDQPQIQEIIPQLREPRVSHTATLMKNGNVVIIGGVGKNKTLSSIEIFDADQNQFYKAGRLKTPRYMHAAVRLNDGRILVAGGMHKINDNKSILRSIEVFNPKTNRTSMIGKLNTARSSLTAELLSNGKVLFIGGANNTPLRTAEVFNPVTQKIEKTLRMVFSHSDFDSIKTSEGKIFVFGGNGSGPASIEKLEINRFKKVSELSVGRFGLIATELSSGDILLTGGFTRARTLNAAEIFNPASNTVQTLPPMHEVRDAHTVTPLQNGKALIAGGANMGKSTPTMEIFDPSTNTFSSIAPLQQPRSSHTATTLTDGRIIFIGGFDGAGQIIPTAEFFRQ
jgi:N-acetylneuraminic acid mutarotase